MVDIRQPICTTCSMSLWSDQSDQIAVSVMSSPSESLLVSNCLKEIFSHVLERYQHLSVLIATHVANLLRKCLQATSNWSGYETTPSLHSLYAVM